MKISSLFGFVVLSSSPSKIAFGRDDGQQRRREFVTDGYALELPEGYTAEESEGVASARARRAARVYVNIDIMVWRYLLDVTLTTTE